MEKKEFFSQLITGIVTIQNNEEFVMDEYDAAKVIVGES
jgi:hypothetical protein